MRFSPSRLKLSRPLADQLTLQRPPLLVSRIGYRDLEHDSLLAALPAGREGNGNPGAKKGQGSRIGSMCLLQRSLNPGDRVAEFRRPNDHETEVWRVCQRFSTSADRISITS